MVRLLIRETRATVVNVDKLTYAANMANVAEIADDPRYRFERADIGNPAQMKRIFQQHRPTAVMHLAAEFGMSIVRLMVRCCSSILIYSGQPS